MKKEPQFKISDHVDFTVGTENKIHLKNGCISGIYALIYIQGKYGEDLEQIPHINSFQYNIDYFNSEHYRIESYCFVKEYNISLSKKEEILSQPISSELAF